MPNEKILTMVLKQKTIYLLDNKYTTKFSVALILLNVIAVILESDKDINAEFQIIFAIIEYVSIAVFTTEYLLRIWVSDKKLKFILSPMGLVDLISILPFYLPFIFNLDLRIVRILRLFRLFRIFKLSRYSKSLRLVTDVLAETKSELIITVFFAFVLLLFSSTLMYYAENFAQPEKFASIIDSLWWAVATLTTVGYGDVYPITGIGKFLSAIIALIGIGFVALPTGIISSAFIDKVKEQKGENQKCCCPHCGEPINNKLV